MTDDMSKSTQNVGSADAASDPKKDAVDTTLLDADKIKTLPEAQQRILARVAENAEKHAQATGHKPGEPTVPPDKQVVEVKGGPNRGRVKMVRVKNDAEGNKIPAVTAVTVYRNDRAVPVQIGFEDRIVASHDVAAKLLATGAFEQDEADSVQLKTQ